MLTDEQRRLVVDNMGLAYSLGWKYCCDMILNRSAEREDIYQIALEALCKAAQSWRPGGTPFGAYAGLCIEHRLLSYRRDHGTRNRLQNGAMLHLDAPAAEGHTFGELLKARDDNICELAELIQALPERQRLAVARTIQGYNQYEIAEEVGIKQPSVSKTLMRARKGLREAMECE